MLTIASPNTDRSLLTLAERRAAVGLPEGDSSRDAELTAMGHYVDALITQACGVVKSGVIPPTLRLETVVETYQFKSVQNGLVLSRMPVVEVTAVTEAESGLDTSDWDLDGQSLFRFNGSARTTWAIGEVAVTYSAGYAVVPYDLKYAAIKFMQVEDTSGSRDPLLKRIVLPDVIEKEYWVDPTKDQIIPSEVLSILERGGYINRFSWMR
jgi:hypothetical protein